MEAKAASKLRVLPLICVLRRTGLDIASAVLLGEQVAPGNP